MRGDYAYCSDACLKRSLGSVLRGGVCGILKRVLGLESWMLEMRKWAFGVCDEGRESDMGHVTFVVLIVRLRNGWVCLMGLK